MEIISLLADYAVVETTKENLVTDNNVENLKKTIIVNGYTPILQAGFRPIAYLENYVFVGIAPSNDVIVVNLGKGLLSPDFVTRVGHDERLSKAVDPVIEVKEVKVLDETNGQDFLAWHIVCKEGDVVYCDSIVA